MSVTAAGEVEIDERVAGGRRSLCLHGESIARNGQVEVISECVIVGVVPLGKGGEEGLVRSRPLLDGCTKGQGAGGW